MEHACPDERRGKERKERIYTDMFCRDVLLGRPHIDIGRPHIDIGRSHIDIGRPHIHPPFLRRINRRTGNQEV